MSLPSFINSWTFYIIKLMIKKNDGQCHFLFTQIKELVFETPLLIYLTYYKDLFCQKNKYDILIYNNTNNTRKEIHCYFFFFFFYLYIYYEYLHKLASLLCFWNSFFIHTSWNQRLLHRTFEPLKKSGIYFFVRMLIKFVLEHICTLFLY